MSNKIKYTLLNFLRAFLYHSGFASLLSLFSKKGAVILTYHRVNKGILQFEKQIRYLAQKKRVVSLEKLIAYFKEGIEFPRDCVVITFDDGYIDNYVNAYPILKKYNMPFTIFLATDYVSSGRWPWWYELEYKIKKSNCEFVVLKENDMKRYNLRNEKEKTKTNYDLRTLLVNTSDEERKKILSELDSALKVEVPKQVEGNIMLSWQDIKEMATDTNVSFGAHTCSHCNLTKVTSKVAKEEIVKSKHVIEKEIGKQIKIFSYPHGVHSEKIKQILKENGFECAVTTHYGKNTLRSDIFELKRKEVSDSLWLFKYHVV